MRPTRRRACFKQSESWRNGKRLRPPTYMHLLLGNVDKAVDDRSMRTMAAGFGPAPYDAVLVQNISQASGGGTNPPAL